ncbi:hypothetical protein MXB_5275 [Myxobolus squamalis]|nr:hypothetical protein MXB_5275 [Myxobolus squamalis]
MSFTQPGGNRKICYYYDSEVGNYYYGQGHPMKPHRIRMAHNLLLNYGVLRNIQVLKPKRATAEQMTIFHSDQYVNFLKNARPEVNYEGNDRNKSSPHNVGEDSPIFDGIFEYSQISSGGSIAGANRLNRKDADIAINYAGGLHHAKKEFASGFCYINDIVLGILELLKYHQKVLYLDIDIHHGDGVEEAFYATNRVMTVSFHKYGEFFPGTGDIRDIGIDKGKYHCVNVPLRDGITDQVYETIFKPVVNRVLEIFKPDAIILQCGADSLTGDRLGCFNLSLKGHGSCVEYIKSLRLPLMVLGGGGYTIRNVARCWAYETALLAGVDLPEELPYNDYYEYYGPDFKLHITPSNATNMNSSEYLDKVRERVFENLRCVGDAPTDNREFSFSAAEESDSDDENDDPNERLSASKQSKFVHPKNEYMETEEFEKMNPSRMLTSVQYKSHLESHPGGSNNTQSGDDSSDDGESDEGESGGDSSLESSAKDGMSVDEAKLTTENKLLKNRNSNSDKNSPNEKKQN